MNDNKKIAVNSVVIFVRLCVVSLVSLIASRIVLDALGASDFGLYNVVGGLVAMLNIVNAAMMSTTYRYIAFEIGKKEKGKPNKIFNTSVIIHTVFAFLIIVLGLTLGEWYIDNYLSVAPGKLDDARFVFHISLITAAISTMFVPYQGLQVAYEKFTVNAIIDIVSNVVRLTALYLFVYSDGNRLRIYAIIMLGFNLIAGFLYGGYCYYHYYNVVKINLYKDIKLIKEMLMFGVWTMIGALANIGKQQGSAVIINFFFGTLVNAAYAVATQVESFIALFARNLNNAAIPQITKNYSGGNMQRSITLTAYISKYTFLLMTLVAFPVALELDFLLGLWLKNVPDGASTFCLVMILTGLLNCMGEGIPAMINATGNIKAYQLVVNCTLLIGLPVGFLCYKIGAGYYAITIVYCVIYGFIGFVKLFMLRRVVRFEVKSFFSISYSKILWVSIPLIVAYLLYNPSSFSLRGHVFGLIGSELYLLVIIYMLGLEKRERKLLKNGYKTIATKIYGRYESR